MNFYYNNIFILFFSIVKKVKKEENKDEKTLNEKNFKKISTKNKILKRIFNDEPVFKILKMENNQKNKIEMKNLSLKKSNAEKNSTIVRIKNPSTIKSNIIYSFFQIK